jgi:hypothetical protein
MACLNFETMTPSKSWLWLRLTPYLATCADKKYDVSWWEKRSIVNSFGFFSQDLLIDSSIRSTVHKGCALISDKDKDKQNHDEIN